MLNSKELIRLFEASSLRNVSLDTVEEPVGQLRGLVFAVDAHIAADSTVDTEILAPLIKDFLDKMGLSHIPVLVLCGMQVQEIRS